MHLEADRAFPVVSEAEVPRAVLAFHASVGAWCDGGFTVILDGSLPYGDEPLRTRCLNALHPHPTAVVGVSADSAVLRARALDRGDPDLTGGQVSEMASTRA